MDPAGSLAIDQQRIKPVQNYYNVAQQSERRDEEHRPNDETDYVARTTTDFAHPARHKKILAGRIVKKYRMSLRNVVHSTQQHLRDVLPAERDSSSARVSAYLRDQSTS